MATKNLTVKISGDNARLKKSLKESRKGITGFGTFLKGFGSKFGMIGGALVGAGAVAGGLGTIRIFTSAIAEVDNLTKLGKQFGMTTEQIQKFKAVAALTGTDLKQLLKGFGALSKQLVQFVRDGTGEGAKVFAELGLSAADLSAAFQTGPVETLRVFGKALNTIENPLKRAALLEEILGARNKQLAVALESVDTVFGRVSERFKRLDLGLTKTETDAVEEFRDTWTEIAFTIENIKLKKFADLAGRLQPFATAVRDLVDALALGSIEKGATALGRAGVEMANIRSPLLFNPLGSFVKGFGLLLQGVDRLFGAGPGKARGALPAPGTGTINGRPIGEILADIQQRLPALPRGLGALPAPGTGTINGKSIDLMLAESKEQTAGINQLVENTRNLALPAGTAIAVAAP